MATSLLLFIAGASIPALGLLFVPLSLQPILAFGLRQGRQRAIIALGAAIAVLSLVGTADLVTGYALVALMTLLLFLAFGRGWPIEYVVATAASGTFAVVAGLLLSTFGSTAAVWQVMEQILRENIEMSLRAYEKVGFSGESLDLLRQRAPQMIALAMKIIPALVVAVFGIVALLNLVMLYRRFPDRRSWIASTRDLTEWKSPEALVWCLILSGFALFLPSWEALKLGALNLFLISLIFYFFQGLAIVAYYFHHKNVPHFLRSLAYLLILFEQVFTLFVVGLGLFDLWGDFRRLKKKNLSTGAAS